MDANVLFRQLGGNRFRAMTGAKDFMKDGNSLRMKIMKNNTGGNHLIITLNSNDLYDMRFESHRLNRKTYELTVKVKAEEKNIPASNLQRVFTELSGLYTRMAEQSFNADNRGNILLYQGYRDTIDKFIGRFNTLEEAENHIYNRWVQDAKEGLQELRSRRDGTFISKLHKEVLKDKELAGRKGVPWSEEEEEYLKEIKLQDAKFTDENKETLKYYEDNMDKWVTEWKTLSQTPMGSIQQSGSWLYRGDTEPPMYQGYSQRYQDGLGNYPYIIFDPAFNPDSHGAESFNADEDDYCMTCGAKDKNPTSEGACDECVCMSSGCDSPKSGKSYSYCEICYEQENPDDTDYDKSGYYAEQSFNADDLKFKEWADQEMKTHGKKESFDDWLDDELKSHGDNVSLQKWGHHELDSHYERYGAEDYEVIYRVKAKYSPDENWEIIGDFDKREDGESVFNKFIGSSYELRLIEIETMYEDDAPMEKTDRLIMNYSSYGENGIQNFNAETKSLPYKWIAGAIALGISLPYISSLLNSGRKK